MNNREYLEYITVFGKFDINNIRDINTYRNSVYKMLENIKNSDLNIINLLKVYMGEGYIPIDYIKICDYIVRKFDKRESKDCIKVIEDLFNVGSNRISLFSETILVQNIRQLLLDNEGVSYSTLKNRLLNLKLFYYHDLFLVIDEDLSYHAINEHDKDGMKCFDIEDEAYDILERDVRAILIKRDKLEFIKDTKELDKLQLIRTDDILGIVVASDV